MFHRMQAALLLLVVGLALPVAGSPLRFCAQAAVFMAGDQACVSCPTEDLDCDCEGGENRSRPNCMTSAKVLPDGVAPGGLVLPSSQSMDLPPQAVGTGETWRIATRSCEFPSDRVPPGCDGVPLYLRNRALRI